MSTQLELKILEVLAVVVRSVNESKKIRVFHGFGEPKSKLGRQVKGRMN